MCKMLGAENEPDGIELLIRNIIGFFSAFTNYLQLIL